MAILCADEHGPDDPEWYWRNIQDSRDDQPIFGALFHNISASAR